MKKKIFLALIAITLFGCATAAQKQANQISATEVQANKDMHKCLETEYNKPENESIRAHLKSPSQAAPNSKQLHDKSYQTKSESALLSEYFENQKACTNEYIRQINTVAPSIAVILAERDNEFDKIRSLLIARKITWGNYYQQFQKIDAEYKNKLAIASRQLQMSLDAAHQAEIRQRQAIGDALQGIAGGMQSMGNAYTNAGNAYGNAGASCPACQQGIQQEQQAMQQQQQQAQQTQQNMQSLQNAYHYNDQQIPAQNLSQEQKNKTAAYLLTPGPEGTQGQVDDPRLRPENQQDLVNNPLLQGDNPAASP